MIQKDIKDEYIVTHSGRRFYPFDPTKSEVHIEDIAHHLSNICRFTGAVKYHYSVAQHSLIVSQLLPVGWRLHGLMHDAEEYVTNDLAKPVKMGLADYLSCAGKIKERIYQRFCLSWPDPDFVHEMDQRVYATGAKDLLRERQTCEFDAILGLRVRRWRPETAEREFLRQFYKLGGDR